MITRNGVPITGFIGTIEDYRLAIKRSTGEEIPSLELAYMPERYKAHAIETRIPEFFDKAMAAAAPTGTAADQLMQARVAAAATSWLKTHEPEIYAEQLERPIIDQITAIAEATGVEPIDLILKHALSDRKQVQFRISAEVMRPLAFAAVVAAESVEQVDAIMASLKAQAETAAADIGVPLGDNLGGEA